MITEIIKRDGRRAPFQIEKIADAIFAAAQASGGRVTSCQLIFTGLCAHCANYQN